MYPTDTGMYADVEIRLRKTAFGRFLIRFHAMYDYMLQSSGQSGLRQIYEDRL
jgi:hypothetical protein